MDTKKDQNPSKEPVLKMFSELTDDGDATIPRQMIDALGLSDAKRVFIKLHSNGMIELEEAPEKLIEGVKPEEVKKTAPATAPPTTPTELPAQLPIKAPEAPTKPTLIHGVEVPASWKAITKTKFLRPDGSIARFIKKEGRFTTLAAKQKVTRIAELIKDKTKDKAIEDLMKEFGWVFTTARDFYVVVTKASQLIQKKEPLKPEVEGIAPKEEREIPTVDVKLLAKLPEGSTMLDKTSFLRPDGSICKINKVTGKIKTAVGVENVEKVAKVIESSGTKDEAIEAIMRELKWKRESAKTIYNTVKKTIPHLKKAEPTPPEVPETFKAISEIHFLKPDGRIVRLDKGKFKTVMTKDTVTKIAEIIKGKTRKEAIEDLMKGLKWKYNTARNLYSIVEKASKLMEEEKVPTPEVEEKVVKEKPELPEDSVLLTKTILLTRRGILRYPSLHRWIPMDTVIKAARSIDSIKDREKAIKKLMAEIGWTEITAKTYYPKITKAIPHLKKWGLLEEIKEKPEIPEDWIQLTKTYYLTPEGEIQRQDRRSFLRKEIVITAAKIIEPTSSREEAMTKLIESEELNLTERGASVYYSLVKRALPHLRELGMLPKKPAAEEAVEAPTEEISVGEPAEEAKTGPEVELPSRIQQLIREKEEEPI